MKLRVVTMLTGLLLSVSLYCQKPSIELIYTAIDSASHVQLDSIKIINRTHGSDTILYWPDTILNMYYVGLSTASIVNSSFRVLQNYPNPVIDQTTISLIVPEKDVVSIIISDNLGRVIQKIDRVLEKGIHHYIFKPGSGSLFFFSASWRKISGSIKILNNSSNSKKNSSLQYIGNEISHPQFKATEDIQNFTFSPGDDLLCIGYANSLQSGLLNTPELSSIYTFQFATNIPCPGTPTVEYEGEVYNTIQIFSQCWLKENLNVGTIIPGDQEMNDNDIIERYCYNNEEDSCDIYGALYQWNEMMQYTTQLGTQGICPPGWHIPSDEDWKILEGASDSQYSIGDPVWDQYAGPHGFDAGTNLKSTSVNIKNNGTDLFGFSALLAGYRKGADDFRDIGNLSYWWTSNEGNTDKSWYHHLYYDYPGVGRQNSSKDYGFSVRCLKD